MKTAAAGLGAAAARPRRFRRRTAEGRLHLSRPGRRLRLDLGAQQGPQGDGRRRSTARSSPTMSRTSRRTRAPMPILKDLAQQGHKLIFTTSYGYMDQTIEVAKQFPDVKFEHCTGYKHADNVGTYNSASIRAAPVEGTIAGMMSKTGDDRLSRLLQGAGSRDGRELVHARGAGGESEHQDQAGHDRFVVRPGQGSGGRADAHQPRLRRRRPAHRQPGRRCRSARRSKVWCFGQGADMSRFAPKAQSDRDRGHLGPLLHLARQGGARRHLEARRRLVGHQGRHGRHVALQQGVARQRRRPPPTRSSPAGRTAPTTSSPGRSWIRPARSASPRASAWRTRNSP